MSLSEIVGSVSLCNLLALFVIRYTKLYNIFIGKCKLDIGKSSFIMEVDFDMPFGPGNLRWNRRSGLAALPSKPGTPGWRELRQVHRPARVSGSRQRKRSSQASTPRKMILTPDSFKSGDSSNESAFFNFWQFCCFMLHFLLSPLSSMQQY